MITERDDEQRNERGSLVLSVVASVAINLAAWMLLIWGWGIHLTMPVAIKDRELIVTSSSITLDRRTVPVPQTHQAVAPRPPTPPHPQHEPQQHVAAAPAPRVQPTEIARIVERATPQPQSSKTKARTPTLQEQLAQQEQTFTREAQQLNQSRAPLSIATIAPSSRPMTSHRYEINLPGTDPNSRRGNGFIEATRSWRDHGLDCYYGQYSYEYPEGGTESGVIPWPFCFAPSNDPIARGDRLIPMPPPVPGYRLPPGTTLQPIPKAVYEAWLASQ